MRLRRSTSVGRVLTLVAIAASASGCDLLAGIDQGTLVADQGDTGLSDAAKRTDAPKDAGTARDARHDAPTLAEAGETGAPEAGSDAGSVDAGVLDATVVHDTGAHDVVTVDVVVATDAGGGVSVAGEPCTGSGAVACGGHASTQVLECQSGKWTPVTPCPAGDLCDSRTGQCATEIVGCVGRSPGDEVCSPDDTATMECGIDLVTATTTPCGIHQACMATGSSATCACSAASNPACAGVTSTRGICSSGNTQAIVCMVDAQGCAYAADTMDCGGGACYLTGATSSCCQDECSTVDQYCANGAAYQSCSINNTTGCKVLSSQTCSGATPACLSGGVCGCTAGAGECGGVSRGANCVSNHAPAGGTICGCVTNGDCFNLGCCGSNNAGDVSTDNQCYANGETVDGYTCNSSTWKP